MDAVSFMETGPGLLASSLEWLGCNGDGVKTLNQTAGQHFDHAGDGFAERTGWVKPDDGWLVRDLNGNGTIDTGAELFGVDTVKRDGSKARDGFDALADLDANQDGWMDAKDAAFASLRVWRDLNQDGISQPGELQTLAQAGIVAISTGGESAGPVITLLAGVSTINPPAANQAYWLQTA